VQGTNEQNNKSIAQEVSPCDRIREVSRKEHSKHGKSGQGRNELNSKPSGQEEVIPCDRIRDMSIKEHSIAWEKCAGYKRTK
jgi:hypothetical protein